jgi:hypothetical protein
VDVYGVSRRARSIAIDPGCPEGKKPSDQTDVGNHRSVAAVLDRCTLGLCSNPRTHWLDNWKPRQLKRYIAKLQHKADEAKQSARWVLLELERRFQRRNSCIIRMANLILAFGQHVLVGEVGQLLGQASSIRPVTVEVTGQRATRRSS